jgi:hypothetical protein
MNKSRFKIFECLENRNQERKRLYLHHGLKSHSLKVIPGTTIESFDEVLLCINSSLIILKSSQAYNEYSIRCKEGYIDGYVDWLMVLHRIEPGYIK